MKNSLTQEEQKKQPYAVNTVTIYLARHGETLFNQNQRVQGWSDAPLTDEGTEVVKHLGKGLTDIPFTSIYSGDSGRHIRTAEIIQSHRNQSAQELIQDSRLREWHFGKFERAFDKMLWKQIVDATGIPFEKVMRNMGLEKIADTIAELDETGEAENWQTISSRTHGVLNEISEKASKNGDENILVVSSGLTINTLLALINPESKPCPIFNSSITKLTYHNSEYKIETVNDMSYVELGKAANQNMYSET